MSRTHVGLGTTVNSYPRSAWSHIPPEIDVHKVWEIVGPQVDMHVRNLPLWRVFCAVYIEGLAHGAAIAEQRNES